MAIAICQCSCNYIVTSDLVCKHVFLAQRVMGHGVCYDTKISGDTNTEEPSEHNLATQPPIIVDEFEQDIYDREVAILDQNLKTSTSMFLERSKKFSDELKKDGFDLASREANLKREMERGDRSWPKRQRRRLLTYCIMLILNKLHIQ